MGKSNTNDDVFIDAPPADVFRAIEALPRDAAWWPGARTTGSGDRLTAGVQGFGRFGTPVRFEARVDGIRPGEGIVWWLESGELSGRGEFWLEPFRAGTIVHYYLDVDPGPGGRRRAFGARVRRHRWAIRGGLNALKDRLEGRAWLR